MAFKNRLTIGALCAAALVGNQSGLLAGELSHLSGSWRGSGVVNRSDGTKERLRCQASYAEAAPSLSMSLKCASDSYNFNLQSSIKNDAGKLSGTWNETTRHFQGNVSGNIDGDTMRATVNSERFSAFLNVRTVGGMQAVTIESPGSDISRVSISLRRS